jgi:hypothetical protein
MRGAGTIFEVAVTETVENTESAGNKPIEIYVSCPWTKRGQIDCPHEAGQKMGIS